MNKHKLAYLLIITIVGGILTIAPPTHAQESDPTPPTCSSANDLGKICDNSAYVCKKVNGTPTCVCRWGYFEVFDPDDDPATPADICAYIDNNSNPREAMAIILSLIINILTAGVIMIAMVSIVIGGYIYMTAGGSADRVGTAKKWIMASILGIILALSAWLILAVVNPNLL